MELTRPKKKDTPPPAPKPAAPKPAVTPARPAAAAKDDDEIDQIKKEIKEAAKKEEKNYLEFWNEFGAAGDFI